MSSTELLEDFGEPVFDGVIRLDYEISLGLSAVGETGMDVRFINAFVGSINNVFETMMNTKVMVGKPYVNPANAESAAEVSGIIGLSGDVQGCVVLSFSSSVAVKIASTFANAELSIDHPDFSDAIGELANMVAGNAKKDFPDCLASISLPSVIIGFTHKVSQPKITPFLVIPCETNLGVFAVEVAILACKKTTAAISSSVAAGGVR